MGIFDRISSILKANVNDMLDKAEDPAKMVDQTLRELNQDLLEVKRETASVMADEQSALRKLNEAKATVARCDAAAMNALKSGKEDDARAIIAEKNNAEASVASLQQAYDAAHANSEKMRAAHDKLVKDIDTLEARKDGIKAKLKVAKTQEHINKVTASDKAAGSISAFNKWEEKANRALDAANAEADLNKGDTTAQDLVAKYENNSSADVDEELAAMKAKIGM